MGVKGRRVHMIEEMSDTIISFQRGKNTKNVICKLLRFSFSSFALPSTDLLHRNFLS